VVNIWEVWMVLGRWLEISWLSTLFKSGDINKRIKDKLYSIWKLKIPIIKVK
jgi:hypothetical protein